jgi:ABC-type antimicrobial peptide transport system permease subunit
MSAETNIIIIIIITTGKTALCEPQPEDFTRLHPVFTSLNFSTPFFFLLLLLLLLLQIKVVEPYAQLPQSGGADLCIYVSAVTGWPSYTPHTGFFFVAF